MNPAHQKKHLISPLHGKVALVVGICATLAHDLAGRLATEGAETICLTHGATATVGNEYWGDGVIQLTAAFDITKTADWERIIARISDNYGRLDILANCASNGPCMAESNDDVEDWLKTTDTKMTSVFLGMKLAQPLLAISATGSIINVVSNLGIRGAVDRSAESSADAAIISLTKSAAKEFHSQSLGVRVNAVCHTPVVGHDRASVSQLSNDVAEAVLFLVSDRAKHINGACIVVDCGISA